jgi:peroxiredoxin
MSEAIEKFGIGQRAPEFQDLPGADGQHYSLSSFDDRPYLVIAFTCNGCPTVKVEEERIKALQEAYAPSGVQFVAINSNNPYLSPPDTYAEMVKRANEKRYNFPYLKDEDGSVAREFGATNTPHFFVLDKTRTLCYTGRMDDTRDPARATYSDLENALTDLLADRTVTVGETQPFGCAIVR